MFKYLFSSFLSVNVYSQYVQGDIMPPLVGNQRDNNNCLISAGYSWCEDSQSCIRQWITPCQDNFNNCDDCLSRQSNGENIACPVDCNNYKIHDLFYNLIFPQRPFFSIEGMVDIYYHLILYGGLLV